MDYAESERRIKAALERRPYTWLAEKLGYASADYVRLMIIGREPATPTFYEDVAEILKVQPRDITPTVGLRLTFARPGARKAALAV